MIWNHLPKSCHICVDDVSDGLAKSYELFHSKHILVEAVFTLKKIFTNLVTLARVQSIEQHELIVRITIS